MLRRLLASASIAAAVLAAAILPSHAQLQKATIATTEGLPLLPFYIARMEGFFEQEGIEFDPVYLPSGSANVAAVLGGSADFLTTSFIQLFKAKIAGGDLRGVGLLSSAFPINIVLSNEAIAKSGITPDMPIDEKVNRLKGLTIGISGPGSSTDTFARSLFLARKINPDGFVKLQPIGAGAATWAAFQQKVIDGFSNTAPWVELAESNNLGRAVIDPLKGEVPELKDVPNNVLATSDKIMKEKPELVAKMLRALQKAVNYARDNPEGVKKVRQFFPKIEEAAFNLAVEKYRKSLPSNLAITQTQFTKALDWNSFLEARIDIAYDSVIDTKVAEAAAAAVKK